MYIDPQTTIHYNLAQFEENLSKNVTCSQQTDYILQKRYRLSYYHSQ